VSSCCCFLTYPNCSGIFALYGTDVPFFFKDTAAGIKSQVLNMVGMIGRKYKNSPNLVNLNRFLFSKTLFKLLTISDMA
jgi:hypothetical protein